MSKGLFTDREKKKKMRLYLFVFFFVLYEAITYAANDMIIPGMLDVVSQFHVSIGYVATSVSAYIFGSTVLQLFLGPAADRYGKKITILTGCFFFLIFTILIMFSGNITQFMLGRFLQGSGCAFIAIGYSIIHEKFDDKTAVKIVSLMTCVTILSPLAGPIIGGFIVSLADWRYVFIIIGIVAFISLCGMFKYTPRNKKIIDRINVRDIISTYCCILKNRNFAIGSFAVCLSTLPLMTWIGLAPVLIIKTAKLSFTHYIMFQVIVCGGFIFGSIVMQFIVGKISFYKIMIIANFLFITGAFLALVFSYSPLLLVIGLFINSLGMEFFDSIAFRIIMSNEEFSQNMTMSLLVFIETLIMATGIEITNLICGQFGFSLFSFALINFLFSVIVFISIYYFAKMNKNRKYS